MCVCDAVICHLNYYITRDTRDRVKDVTPCARLAPSCVILPKTECVLVCAPSAPSYVLTLVALTPREPERGVAKYCRSLHANTDADANTTTCACIRVAATLADERGQKNVHANTMQILKVSMVHALIVHKNKTLSLVLSLSSDCIDFFFLSFVCFYQLNSKII